MKDKEKQIEQMAIRDKLIDVLLKAHRECIFLEQEQPYPCEGCKYRTIDRSIRGCVFDRYADAIIESGIFCDNSKPPKDSVVLSKEEYEKLTAPRVFIKPRQLNSEELAKKLKDFNYGIIGVDKSSIEIIPTRAEMEKETAEKIYRMADEICTGSQNDGDKILAMIKNTFGVDIRGKNDER